MSEQQWFDDLPDHGLQDQEHGPGPQRHRPVRPDRGCKDQRKNRGNHRADVWHETQYHRQHSPQGGAWNANEPQAEADHHAIGRIEAELGQKQSAEPLAGVVERSRGALEILGACQPHQPIPQILLLHQDKDHEDDHDAGGCQRMDKRRDQRHQGLQCAGIRLLDLDWDRPIRSRAGGGQADDGTTCRGLVELAAQVLQHLRGALQRAGARRRAAQALNLLAQGGLIARQLAGELVDLRNHQRAEAENSAEGGEHDEDDGQQQCRGRAKLAEDGPAGQVRSSRAAPKRSAPAPHVRSTTPRRLPR